MVQVVECLRSFSNTEKKKKESKSLLVMMNSHFIIVFGFASILLGVFPLIHIGYIVQNFLLLLLSDFGVKEILGLKLKCSLHFYILKFLRVFFFFFGGAGV
jgi:hypothetical protein